jgi:hypothetical protein
MLRWLWRGQGRAHRGAGVAMTGLDEIFHPEAARAREFVEIQHEMVVPLPGADDRPWDDGTIVIDLPENPER